LHLLFTFCRHRPPRQSPRKAREDFDKEAATITVSGKIARIQGQGLKRMDSGKTDSSKRTVPLPEFAVTALDERRGRPFWGEQRMTFPSAAGTCRDPDNFNKQWRKVRDGLGVPDVTSHSFRKTVATLIDDAGAVRESRRRSAWARESVDDPGPLHAAREDSRRGCRPAGPIHRR